MIQKIAKGRGMRGTLNYVLANHDAEGRPRQVVEIVGGTMAGRSPRELSAEFGALRRQRPNLGIAVCHVSLRQPEGDRPLSRDEWAEAGRRWAEGMGFDSYITVSHGDHAHVVGSRIRVDGTVVSDSQDYARGERIVREIEKDFGIQQVAPSHLLEPDRATNHRKAPTHGEIAQAERGETPPAQLVAEAIERRLAAGPCTAVEFCEALEAAGISVRPNIAATGKMNGFGYEVDGQAMTSKQLGRGFTWKNLTDRGVSYDQNRDAPGLRSRLSRAAEPSDPGRGISPGPDQAEPGGPSIADRAGVVGLGRGDSPELGAADDELGRVVPDQAELGRLADADRASVVSLGRGDGGSIGASGDKPRGIVPRDDRRPVSGPVGTEGGADPGRDPSPAAGPGAERRDLSPDRPAQHGPGSAGRTSDGVEGSQHQPDGRQPRADEDRHNLAGRPETGALRSVGQPAPNTDRRERPGHAGDRIPVGDSMVDRIADLAAPAIAASGRAGVGPGGRHSLAATAGPGAGAVAASPRADRTAAAVDRYLNALEAHSYTVAVRRPDGTVIRREDLTADQVRLALPWLRRENALGADVYARPGGTAYVLLDDVPADQLERARAAGHEPALVMETSPGNLAAWVRVGHGLRVSEATELNRGMAKKYGADPAAIDPKHLSRLPGLTNRKPERLRPDGQPPFVLVREAWGKVCSAAEKARQWARDRVQRLADQAKAQLADMAVAGRLHAIHAAAGDGVIRDPADAYRHHAARAMQADPQACQDHSALDFRAAQRMFQAGHTFGEVAEGIEAASPELVQRKGEATAEYAERTAEAAWQSRAVQQYLAAQQASTPESEKPKPGYP